MRSELRAGQKTPEIVIPNSGLEPLEEVLPKLKKSPFIKIGTIDRLEPTALRAVHGRSCATNDHRHDTNTMSGDDDLTYSLKHGNTLNPTREPFNSIKEMINLVSGLDKKHNKIKVEIAAKQHARSPNKNWRNDSKQSNQGISLPPLTTNYQQEIEHIKHGLEALKKSIGRVMEKDNTQTEIHTQLNTSALLQPIKERLKIMIFDLKALREHREKTPPPQVQFRDRADARTNRLYMTYAKKAATPSNLRPNHTLTPKHWEAGKKQENPSNALQCHKATCEGILRSCRDKSEAQLTAALVNTETAICDNNSQTILRGKMSIIHMTAYSTTNGLVVLNKEKTDHTERPK
ncbi:hypothetical protein EVAR_17182_1 [Eumeta japonica]|uniref:Uncharacterized protein n=1 Tax=Eumeta variegata TaxID=151549 RepID=A0A4C1U955_EUMVA|nr:hypothetical protein EVAR_17182_1 [Eumeta japonica]